MLSLDELYEMEDCVFDPYLCMIIAVYRVEKLTYAEAKILRLLLSSPDGTVSRDAIAEALNFRVVTSNSRAIDVRVSGLRGRLRTFGLAHRLRSVRCFGYQFDGYRRKVPRTAEFELPFDAIAPAWLLVAQD